MARTFYNPPQKATGTGQIFLSRMYSVWCAGCDSLIDFLEFPNLRGAENYFKAQGWTKKRGKWHCPGCSKKEG